MTRKGTHKYVNEIQGNLSLAKFQKIVLNSTAQFLEEHFHSKGKARLSFVFLFFKNNPHYFQILYVLFFSFVFCFVLLFYGGFFIQFCY